MPSFVNLPVRLYFFLKVAETGSSLNPPLSMIYSHFSAQNFSISYLKPLKVPNHATASTAVSVVPIGPLIIPTPGGAFDRVATATNARLVKVSDAITVWCPIRWPFWGVLLDAKTAPSPKWHFQSREMPWRLVAATSSRWA